MLFEQRTASPDASPALLQIRDSFLSGWSRKAWEDVQNIGLIRAAQTPEDWVLLIELARAVGNHAKAAAISRLAHRHYPNYFAIQIYFVRVQMMRGRLGSAIDYLKSLEGKVAVQDEAVRIAELASVFADADLDDSASNCINRLLVAGDQVTSDPIVQYIISCAFQSMRKWEKAVEHGQVAIALAPGWMRARGFLIHCLLGVGRVNDAIAIWEEGREKIRAEEASFELVGSVIAFSLGQMEGAARGFAQFIERWPDGENANMATCSLFLILVELGRLDEARAVREKGTARKKDLFEGMPDLPEDAHEAGGKHALIPLPIGSQNKNHCVPTVVAMATHAQGTPLDPTRLFDEMHGREGTALWRMREWLQNNGFTVVPVKLDVGCIRALIDLGIPLMGALEGPFSAHVDLICGYNETLEAFYIRDPSFWAPGFGPYESILKRYEMHSGVYAIIASDNHEAIAAAEFARSPEATALLDLAEHVARARREPAEAAAGIISDTSPAACLRDTYGHKVTVSPRIYQERCEAIGADKEAPPVARFRSLLSIDGGDNREKLDEVLESQSDILGKFGKRYVNLLQAMTDGEWELALKLVDELLFSASTVAQMWSMKSDILAELGQTADSEECLQRAIELMPRAVWLREKLLRQNERRLTFAEFLEEIDRLIAEDPDQTGMLWARALALQEGPDGAVLEEAVQTYIRFFPRDPNGYLLLAAWLNAQGRADLAKIQLERGWQVLEKEDLPDLFEEPEDEKKEEQEQLVADVDAAVELPGEKLETEVLPEDREELIKIAGSIRNPLQEEAMAELERLGENGSLLWHEYARLVVCRVLVAESRLGTPPTMAEIEAMLPLDPPGARHWFAATVSETLGELPMRVPVFATIAKWIERVVPEFKSHVPLWFERVCLSERMGNMEEAIAGWEEFLQVHHSDSSAYYRLGNIKGSQADYPTAVGHFRKALEISPGLPGALQGLLQCSRILDDKVTEKQCIEGLRKRFPYQAVYLMDEAALVADTRGHAAAEKVIQAASSCFTDIQLNLIRAQKELDMGRAEKAVKLVSQIDPGKLEDQEFETWLGISLQDALDNRKRDRTIQLCDLGLARWKDSTKLRQIKAEQIAENNPTQALKEFEIILSGDDPSPTAAFYFMVLGAIDQAFNRARDFINGVEERSRERLAGCFAEAFSDPDLRAQAMLFGQWSANTFPDNPAFQSSYAEQLHAQHRQKEAVAVARKLVADFPEEPEWEFVLGRILIDSDPNKAIAHLERSYQRNKSSGSLLELARCHQLLGDNAKAIQCHKGVLVQNPFAGSSISNLHLLGEPPESLWKFINPAMEKGAGVTDEYFLVIAIRIAKATGNTVSPAWLPATMRRMQVLETQPGFGDEKKQLFRALASWKAVRPNDFPSYRPSLMDQIVSLFSPGRKWIPRDY